MYVDRHRRCEGRCVPFPYCGGERLWLQTLLYGCTWTSPKYKNAVAEQRNQGGCEKSSINQLSRTLGKIVLEAIVFHFKKSKPETIKMFGICQRSSSTTLHSASLRVYCTSNVQYVFIQSRKILCSLELILQKI